MGCVDTIPNQYEIRYETRACRPVSRARAVIAWVPATDEIRSGQVDAPPRFGHWLLKFDGIACRQVCRVAHASPPPRSRFSRMLVLAIFRNTLLMGIIRVFAADIHCSLCELQLLL